MPEITDDPNAVADLRKCSNCRSRPARPHLKTCYVCANSARLTRRKILDAGLCIRCQQPRGNSKWNCRDCRVEINARRRAKRG